MTLGRFDSDTDALVRRIASHDKFGSTDITPWILQSLDPQPGNDVLDLGCGTGKQTIPAAQIVGSTGSVMSVDVSADALKIVNERAVEAGFGDRVLTVESGLDDLRKVIGERRFQRSVGCYSLYYANDRQGLFQTIHDSLDDGGVLFFCGPSHLNNDELKRFHHDLRGEEVTTTEAANFMEDEAPAIVGGLFSSVERLEFQNPLRFDSAEALRSYWSSYNLYDPERDDDFMKAATDYFKSNPTFETVKRAVGIRATR